MKESTPPPLAPQHNPPLLPSSPLAKRPKTVNQAMVHSTPTTRVEEGPPLLIKKLTAKAKTPTRGSAFAAGYDIYSARDIIIPARGKALVDTEIAIAVPGGTCKASGKCPA